MNTEEAECWEKLKRTLKSDAVQAFINAPPPNCPCLIEYWEEASKTRAGAAETGTHNGE
jgi:hypothetical protein